MSETRVPPRPLIETLDVQRASPGRRVLLSVFVPSAPGVPFGSSIPGGDERPTFTFDPDVALLALQTSFITDSSGRSGALYRMVLEVPR